MVGNTGFELPLCKFAEFCIANQPSQVCVGVLPPAQVSYLIVRGARRKTLWSRVFAPQGVALTKEARRGFARAGLELGMELGGNEVRVVVDLYNLHALPGLVLAHEAHARRLDLIH